MANGKFVAYYRVSTVKQGRSGLGEEAQKQAVHEHLNGGRWKLVAEVSEQESGKRNDRPELLRALSLCRAHNATLVIAKLDRLARNVAFVSSLMESGVDFIALDCQQANKFTIHILAAVAEHEANLISQRTKAALEVARRRRKEEGIVLKPNNPHIGREALKGARASAAVRSAKASKLAADLLPVIADIRAKGATSLREVAAELNERGITTPRGGEWSAVQVMRIQASA